MTKPKKERIIETYELANAEKIIKYLELMKRLLLEILCNIILIIIFIIIPIIIIFLILNDQLADICITSEIYTRNEQVPLIIFFERLMKTNWLYRKRNYDVFNKKRDFNEYSVTVSNTGATS